jgi:cytochrome P450
MSSPSLAVPTPLGTVEAPRQHAWPLLGALVPMMRLGTLEYFRRAWERHGDIFRVRLGPRDVVAVVHPDGIEHILVKRRDNYVKGRTYDGVRLLTGEGLLTLEGQPWLKRRRLAQPAFHKERLARLAATMVEVVRDELDGWRATIPDGGVIDAHAQMMRITLEVVGATLLGERFGRDETDRSAVAFGEALELLSARGNLPVALPLSWPTPGNRRLRRAVATVDAMVARIITRARTQPEHDRPTLLRMLVDARDAESGEGLTDRELRDEVVTLVLAGHETTALLLTWGFTLLGQHPEVVLRMRGEVEQILGDRDPTPEDLPKLTYLGYVIDEILRLRPPTWATGRDVVADDVVCGHRVYAGETVMPMMFLTHRHPGFWEEPSRFDPERFRPERARGRHHAAYLPFSTGPRMCIGNHFTLIEAKIILAMLLQRAEVELVSHRPVPARAGMTVRPAAPVGVRLRWRKRR